MPWLKKKDFSPKFTLPSLGQFRNDLELVKVGMFGLSLSLVSEKKLSLILHQSTTFPSNTILLCFPFLPFTGLTSRTLHNKPTLSYGLSYGLLPSGTTCEWHLFIEILTCIAQFSYESNYVGFSLVIWAFISCSGKHNLWLTTSFTFILRSLIHLGLFIYLFL